MAAQFIGVGSVKGNWVYGYIHPFTWRILVVSTLVSIIAIGALLVSIELIERFEWTTVAAWLLVGFAMQASLRSLTPFGIDRIFVSNGANSFYQVSLRYEPATVLRDFSRVRMEWPLHARSNMPGKLLLVDALEHVASRPRTLAWLVVGISNLGGLLFYAFARDLFADRRIALFAIVLYLLVPAKLYFFPLLNTVTPTLVIAWLYLVFLWIRTGSSAAAVLSGVALYVLLFFEPLPLVMGLVPLAFAIRSLRRDGRWLRFMLQSLGCLGAFLAIHVAVQWWTGFSAIAGFRELGAEAVAFNVEARRRYVIWVWQNLLDFAVAIGICQTVMFLAALNDARRHLTEPIGLLCAALATVLIVTDLAGVNRGEIVRLWIFLACFFQIPVAYICARLDSRFAIVLVVASTVLQDAIGTAMIGFIMP